MHIHFDKVPHKRVEYFLRRRMHRDHLRILVVLPGRKRKHLANVGLTFGKRVHPETVGPILEQCRRRLAMVCDDQAEVNRLLAQIEERLSREVEATVQAREEHRRELEAEEDVAP
ncbi:MAG: hypothetical protein WBP56_02540 [Polyangia bacterium]